VPRAFRVGAAPRIDLALVPAADLEPGRFETGVLLPSGDLVLGAATGPLARFGPEGDLRWTRALGVLSLAAGPADSVTALISTGDSVVVIGPDGEERRLGLARSGAEPVEEVFPLEGGLLARTGWSTALLDRDARPGVRTDRVHLLRFGADGAWEDTLATVVGSELGLISLGGRIAVAPPLLPRLTVVAAGGGRIFLGTGERDEVAVLDVTGAVRELWRREGRDLRTSRTDSTAARQARARFLGGNPLAERIVAEMDRVLPMPARRPPYAEMALDPAGRLWLAGYPPPGELPSSWSVFGADGALLGDVDLPIGFRLLDVGTGRILGSVPGGGGGTVRVYDLLPAGEGDGPPGDPP
jgi:hypothetical protein